MDYFGIFRPTLFVLFLDSLGLIWDSLWILFGFFLDSFWILFGTHFGILLDSFWNSFGILFGTHLGTKNLHFKHAFCHITPWGLFKQRGVAKCPKWTVGVV